MARSRSLRRAQARSRKRKLAAADPGAILILDRKRTAGKTQQFRGKGLLKMAMKVSNDLQFDGDIRKLCEYIRDDLGAHIRDSWMDGVRADGTGPLPDLSPNTLSRPDNAGRAGGFAMRSGRSVTQIYLGPIRGGTVHAKATITPSRDPALMRLISFWLSRPRPVDLLSIDGAAAKVITGAIERWQEDSLGEFVLTPAQPDTTGGEVGPK